MLLIRTSCVSAFTDKPPHQLRSPESKSITLRSPLPEHLCSENHATIRLPPSSTRSYSKKIGKTMRCWLQRSLLAPAAGRGHGWAHAKDLAASSCSLRLPQPCRIRHLHISASALLHKRAHVHVSPDIPAACLDTCSTCQPRVRQPIL